MIYHRERRDETIKNGVGWVDPMLKNKLSYNTQNTPSLFPAEQNPTFSVNQGEIIYG
jgi:hypothetical protein